MDSSEVAATAAVTIETATAPVEASAVPADLGEGTTVVAGTDAPAKDEDAASAEQ
jgi:hypothetical protein